VGNRDAGGAPLTGNILKTDRIPVDPVHAAAAALEREVADLHKRFYSTPRTGPQRQRFDRVIHFTRYALIAANDIIDRHKVGADPEAQHWAAEDRKRALATVDQARDQVERLMADLEARHV
jgi:hypothetical protein